MENTNGMEETAKKSNKPLWLLIAGVIIVLLVLWKVGLLPVASGSSVYQAVFLSNNQVYFGKLSSPGSKYAVLKEVYYLQVSQTLQPKGAENPQTNVNLVKLGGEIHGPSDKMFINRDHILFYEDLKSDSQVAQAIKQYKDNQK